MIRQQSKKVSFPEYSYYNYALKYFIEQGLETAYVMAPPMTVHTLERGSRLSPDFVCTPFKATLGSMIDALEAGADTLIMPMGLCRLGYYGELQEQILRDRGYKFDFINLSLYSTEKKSDYIKALKRVNPKFSKIKAVKAGGDAVKMVIYMDNAERMYYQNCGFEAEKGSYKAAYNRFLTAMETADNRKDIETAYSDFKNAVDILPVNKPIRPLRVGILGEIFTALDPFSNLYVEQKIADMGVEVHRYINITNRLLRYSEKNMAVETADYCKYDMGPTSAATIWAAKHFAAQGFDGLIHIKSAGCTPEIDVMPVLQNISRDFHIPIMYLTFDSQTSDTGLYTRLEAFYDMISMRRRGR